MEEPLLLVIRFDEIDLLFIAAGKAHYANNWTQVCNGGETIGALAIADELHSIQKDRGDREELMREQAERCLTLVERALKQTA